MSINQDEVSKVSSDLLEKLKTGRPYQSGEFDGSIRPIPARRATCAKKAVQSAEERATTAKTCP